MVTDEQAKENIKANLARLLVDRGWSQNELARRTKESRMTISNVCRGNHVPSAALLARIAEALDVSMDRIVDFPPEPVATNSRKAS